MDELEKTYQKFQKILEKSEQQVVQNEEKLVVSGDKNKKINKKVKNQQLEIQKLESKLSELDFKIKKKENDIANEPKEYSNNMFKFQREDLDQAIENIYFSYCNFCDYQNLDTPFEVIIYVESQILDVKLNRKIINFGHLATEVEGLCGINQKHIYFKNSNDQVYLNTQNIREELLFMRDYQMMGNPFKLFTVLSSYKSQHELLYAMQNYDQGDDILNAKEQLKNVIYGGGAQKGSIMEQLAKLKRKRAKVLDLNEASKTKNQGFSFLMGLLYTMILISQIYISYESSQLSKRFATKQALDATLPTQKQIESIFRTLSFSDGTYYLANDILRNNQLYILKCQYQKVNIQYLVIKRGIITPMNYIRVIQMQGDGLSTSDCKIFNNNTINVINSKNDVCKKSFHPNEALKAYKDASALQLDKSSQSGDYVRNERSLYGFSGFQTIIPMEQNLFNAQVQTLKNQNWIGPYVRVVNIFINLWNNYNELFTRLIISIERTGATDYDVNYDIRSTVLDKITNQSFSNQFYGSLIVACLFFIIQLSSFVYDQELLNEMQSKGMTIPHFQIRNKCIAYPNFIEASSIISYLALFYASLLIQKQQIYFSEIKFQIANQDYIDFDYQFYEMRIQVYTQAIMIFGGFITIIKFFTESFRRFRFVYLLILNILTYGLSLLFGLFWLILLMGFFYFISFGEHYKKFYGNEFTIASVLMNTLQQNTFIDYYKDLTTYNQYQKIILNSNYDFYFLLFSSIYIQVFIVQLFIKLFLVIIQKNTLRTQNQFEIEENLILDSIYEKVDDDSDQDY